MRSRRSAWRKEAERTKRIRWAQCRVCLTNVQRWRFFIPWSSWKNKYESMNLALGHLQKAICPATAEVTHLLPLLAKMSTSCACLWLPQANPEGGGLRHMKPIPTGFQRDPPLEFKKYIYKLFSVGAAPTMTHPLWSLTEAYKVKMFSCLSQIYNQGLNWAGEQQCSCKPRRPVWGRCD